MMDGNIEFDENDLPFAPAFGDHYYSRNDGRLECQHVFIGGNDLPNRWPQTESFTIGELGFGTGLNFLETWRQWQLLRGPEQRLHFVSVEGFPMARETAERALARFPDLADLTAQLLAKWPLVTASHETLSLDEQTQLTVHIGLAENCVPNFPPIDAWFLDGFSPAKNEAMWSAELMAQVFKRTAPDGTFSSYTAAGFVRRNLADAGFHVEKRVGFGTKRDMIGGHRP